MPDQHVQVTGEKAMKALGADLAARFGAGNLVLLQGELGAGKTTLVRGMLEGLGFEGSVKSPTFNLMQTYETNPPVLHADLYRLKNARELGLEEYFETHLCLIEWPERAGDSWPPEAILIRIEFQGDGRLVTVHQPDQPQ